ncbi:TRAP transporter small permease [Cohaesibacter haloalkalitolerans]|uniref:TRAP transporter small permease n=1 Tax=Cohaesibacter haloalkalitolerans TaxID=1162980 RepID=UPI000E64CF24|nr:TRAP transporter small permease [Cohaesibacter haloalkalitolerans]
MSTKTGFGSSEDEVASEESPFKFPSHPDDPAWLAFISRISSALNLLCAVISAVLIALMTLLIIVEICLRFFSLSTFMADTLVGYGVAATTFLAAAWALEHGAMIRVTALTGVLPSFGKWIAEVFCLVATEAILLFLVQYQWNTVFKYWARGTVGQHYIKIPLWIPESFFLIGLVLLALQVLVRLLRLFAVGHTSERSLKI